MDRATIAMWLKDQSKLSGYDNETRPVEGVDNVIKSILHIKNFTHEDQGNYTCYCYYNRSIVTSDKLVTSDQATINVHAADSDNNKSKGELRLVNVFMIATSHFNRETCADMGDHNQYCVTSSSYSSYRCRPCSQNI